MRFSFLWMWDWYFYRFFGMRYWCLRSRRRASWGRNWGWGRRSFCRWLRVEPRRIGYWSYRWVRLTSRDLLIKVWKIVSPIIVLLFTSYPTRNPLILLRCKNTRRQQGNNLIHISAIEHEIVIDFAGSKSTRDEKRTHAHISQQNLRLLVCLLLQSSQNRSFSDPLTFALRWSGSTKQRES